MTSNDECGERCIDAVRADGATLALNGYESLLRGRSIK
jgi:hypothetical protein